MNEVASVLIAEPEEPRAETLAHIVRGAGCSPVVALAGMQALALVRTVHPRLLILEMHLPLLEGTGLIRQMRADSIASGNLTLFAPSILFAPQPDAHTVVVTTNASAQISDRTASKSRGGITGPGGALPWQR